MNTQNNNELINAGRDFRDMMTSETALIDIAKMISNLASQLDLTTAALREKTKQCDALAVENVGLTTGCGFFAYDPDNGFEEFKTRDEAIAAAESYIDYYRGDACDGWADEVDQVSWGIIMQGSTQVGLRPREEDDSGDPSIPNVCDYALLPNIDTPATDAFLAEVKAQGVEELLNVEPAQLIALMPEPRKMTVSEENVRDVLDALRKGAVV